MKQLDYRITAFALALGGAGVIACSTSESSDFGFGREIVLTGDGVPDGGVFHSGGGNLGGGGSSGGAGTSNTGATGGSASAGTGSGGGGAGTGGLSGSAGTHTGDPDAGANAANNLLDNGSFEAGTSGWSAVFGGVLSASSLHAHSGSQSARVTERTETYHGVHYDVAGVVQLGATYLVSAFALLDGAASDTVRLTARFRCEGQADQYRQIDSATGNDSSWTELSGQLAIPSAFECAVTSVLVYVEGPAAGVDLYVDDVHMEQSAPPVSVQNLVANSDFESGTTGWTAGFGGTLSVSTARFHGGAQSAVVTDRAETYQGAHLDVTALVQPGMTYTFSAFVSIIGGDNVPVNLTALIHCVDQEAAYRQLDTTSADETSWRFLIGELEVPTAEACTLTELLVYVEGPPAGIDVYLDDVWGVQTTP